jgi:hypothetical protein
MSRSKLAFSISNREVGDSSEEKYEMIVAAVKGVGATERCSWRAVGPFAVRVPVVR